LDPRSHVLILASHKPRCFAKRNYASQEARHTEVSDEAQQALASDDYDSGQPDPHSDSADSSSASDSTDVSSEDDADAAVAKPKRRVFSHDKSMLEMTCMPTSNHFGALGALIAEQSQGNWHYRLQQYSVDDVLRMIEYDPATCWDAEDRTADAETRKLQQRAIEKRTRRILVRLHEHGIRVTDLMCWLPPIDQTHALRARRDQLCGERASRRRSHRRAARFFATQPPPVADETTLRININPECGQETWAGYLQLTTTLDKDTAQVTWSLRMDHSFRDAGAKTPEPEEAKIPAVAASEPKNLPIAEEAKGEAKKTDESETKKASKEDDDADEPIKSRPFSLQSDGGATTDSEAEDNAEKLAQWEHTWATTPADQRTQDMRDQQTSSDDDVAAAGDTTKNRCNRDNQEYHPMHYVLSYVQPSSEWHESYLDYKRAMTPAEVRRKQLRAEHDARKILRLSAAHGPAPGDHDATLEFLQTTTEVGGRVRKDALSDALFEMLAMSNDRLGKPKRQNRTFCMSMRLRSLCVRALLHLDVRIINELAATLARAPPPLPLPQPAHPEIAATRRRIVLGLLPLLEEHHVGMDDLVIGCNKQDAWRVRVANFGSTWNRKQRLVKEATAWAALVAGIQAWFEAAPLTLHSVERMDYNTHKQARHETMATRMTVEGWTLEQRFELALAACAFGEPNERDSERHAIVPYQQRVAVRLDPASDNALVVSSNVHYYKTKYRARGFMYYSVDCCRPLDARELVAGSGGKPDAEVEEQLQANAIANRVRATLVDEAHAPDVTVLLHPLWLANSTLSPEHDSDVAKMSHGGNVVYWTKMVRLLLDQIALTDEQLTADVDPSLIVATATCYRQVALAMLETLWD
jgi:hypothetical protein